MAQKYELHSLTFTHVHEPITKDFYGSNVQIFTIVEIQFSETTVVEMQFTFSETTIACLNTTI